eukprot:5938594-Pleurochrysis_carterae.AAC.1
MANFEFDDYDLTEDDADFQVWSRYRHARHSVFETEPTGAGGEVHEYVMLALATVYLSPADWWYVVEQIREVYHATLLTTACFGEMVDRVKEYRPSHESLRRLDGGIHAWHRRAQTIFDLTGLVQPIAIP